MRARECVCVARVVVWVRARARARVCACAVRWLLHSHTDMFRLHPHAPYGEAAWRASGSTAMATSDAQGSRDSS